MAALFVARHAPTRIEVGTCVGQLDVPSHRDPLDVAEALLSRWTGAADVCCVWSSPLRRCSEVANVLAARWHVPHRIDSRLLEISYGRWEGRRWDEIERVDGEALRAWMGGWERRGPPGGESAAAVEARVRSWWESLAVDQDEVLIAHAGVIRALHVVAAGCNWNQAMQISVSHTEWIHIAKP
jgi:alpha-ribazole phosphatase